jgi:hypothetical protein
MIKESLSFSNFVLIILSYRRNANINNRVTSVTNTKKVTIRSGSGKRVTSLENDVNKSLTSLKKIPSPRAYPAPTPIASDYSLSQMLFRPPQVKKMTVNHRTYNIHIIR